VTTATRVTGWIVISFQAALQTALLTNDTAVRQNEGIEELVGTCPIPADASFEIAFQNIPQVVRSDIMQRLPSLRTDSRGRIEFSDAHAPPGYREFVVGIRNRHSTWVIVYRSGYQRHFRALRYFMPNASSGAPGPHVLSPLGSLQGPLCAVIDAAMGNVSSLGPPTQF
jgi:hypothetical protein